MITDNQARRLLRGAALSALLLLTAAPAALADPQGYHATIEQRACAADLGLAPGTAEYDTCVKTLDRDLYGTLPGQRREATREELACAHSGFNPNSPAFVQCAADLRASLWNEMNFGAR